MGLNILTNSEFTFQRRECGGIFCASTQSSREQNSALTSQLHTVETATLEPFPINYIKQANPKATVLTSFIRESPGNQSFADLVIKPGLNYRTRCCESQCSTRRRDKHEKIKCSGLLPESCCQPQENRLAFSQVWVPWKASHLSSETVPSIPNSSSPWQGSPTINKLHFPEFSLPDPGAIL